MANSPPTAISHIDLRQSAAHRLEQPQLAGRPWAGWRGGGSGFASPGWLVAGPHDGEAGSETAEGKLGRAGESLRRTPGGGQVCGWAGGRLVTERRPAARGAGGPRGGVPPHGQTSFAIAYFASREDAAAAVAASGLHTWWSGGFLVKIAVALAEGPGIVGHGRGHTAGSVRGGVGARGLACTRPCLVMPARQHGPM